MAAFLSEGSKFLFFDTSICRNTVWFPSGAESSPRVAEECSLGATGIYSIVAGIIFFICLILVCLKAPEKRELAPHYGTDNDHDSDIESAHDYGYSEGSYGEVGSAGMYDVNGSEDQDHYEAGLPSARQDDQEVQYTADHPYGDDEYGENTSQSSGPVKGEAPDPFMSTDELVSKRLKTLDTSEDKYSTKPKDDLDDSAVDDRYQPTKPASSAPAKIHPVSESRLQKTPIEVHSACGRPK